MSSAFDFEEAAALTQTALTFPELLADAKRVGCFHRLTWTIAAVGLNSLGCFVPFFFVRIRNYLHFVSPQKKRQAYACPGNQSK